MTTRLRTFLLVLAGLSFAQQSWAEPTASERETARTLLLSGREKRKSGNLKEALVDLERAHGIMHVPTTGLELGKAQAALGLLVEARATLRDAARHSPEDDEPRAFKRARSEANELADALASRLATLNITSPAGARVTLDGDELSASSAAAPLKVNPGAHTVTASLDGRESRRSITLSEGETNTIRLAVSAAPAPVVTATATKEPKEPPTATTAVTTSPLVWVGVGTGAAGLAVGVVSAFSAFRIKSSVTGRCEGAASSKFLCPPSTFSELDDGETLANVATVAFSVAAIGAGIFVYGLLNPRRVSTVTSASLPLGVITW